MDQYNINQMLEELGIRPINNGLHTGVKWIETNGELIESYSPTDGKLIAKVNKRHGMIMKLLYRVRRRLFFIGDWFRRLSAVRSSDRLVKN